MKKLPEKFRKWGFDWTVLKRKGDVVLLQQSGRSFNGYNVAKVREQPEREIGGNIYPAKEAIPSQTEWGIYAWNFGKDLTLAEERFKLLTDE